LAAMIRSLRSFRLASTAVCVLPACHRRSLFILRCGLRDLRLALMPRELIVERVWNYDFGPTSNPLEVYISYLRRKTEAGGEPRLIHTVRGVGYALREP
jgi:hypothetical protein